MTPALILMFAMMCGCDRRSGGDNTPLTEVRLGYFPNLTHAQAVLGVSSGDFARAVAPMKLTPRTFNAGPSLIEELFAGHIDVGYVGPGPVINAFVRSKGRGIRVVGGAAEDGVVIVARKDAGIRSIGDLVGRNVATPQLGNTQDVSARHYLKYELGQAELSNVRPIANADQATLMARGQIDAAWAPEPWGSILIGKAGAVPVAEEKDLWADGHFSLTVIVTTPEFLAAHGDVVRQLLAVNRTWTERLTANPQAIAPALDDALADLTGKPLPKGVTASALRRIRFVDQPRRATFEKYAKWSVDLEFAREVPDLAGLFAPVDARATSDIVGWASPTIRVSRWAKPTLHDLEPAEGAALP